jgi:hypothetical protein
MVLTAKWYWSASSAWVAPSVAPEEVGGGVEALSSAEALGSATSHDRGHA